MARQGRYDSLVTICLTSELKERLEAEADAHAATTSQYARQVLAQALREGAVQ